MRRLWIASAMVAGSVLIGSRAVSAGQAHPKAPVVYQVQAGDTLWTIASRLAPANDPREIIGLLMKANHLGSPTIIPGQTLRFVAP
jgi:LysM repeat protein